MPRYDFDLFTLGAGSGGVRASRRAAAAHGARVAVAEERRLGGTCVNVGCIPKKLLVYAAHFAAEAADAAAGFGWRLSAPVHDWAALIANKDREIERLNGVYASQLAEAGVRVIEGHAVVVDPHTVEVDGRRHTAEHLVVATGSAPHVPDVPGRELAITSDEAFALARLPRRVVIVGGGYVAAEFAGIFHGLGAEVVQLYRGPLFLRGFDEDVRHHLAGELLRQGVDLRFDANVDAVEPRADGLRALLADGTSLDADAVMMSTGRRPRTAGLGLEQVGVALDERGAVVVDCYSRSSVPSIHAVGDVTDRLNLTPVALYEADALIHTLFAGEPTAPDHENVPTAVFSQPPIGSVGLTEARARERFGKVDVYRSTFRPLKQTLTGSDETTFMKLVVEPESDRVVGLHMVGSNAAEITQGFSVAIKAGATKAVLDATVGIHPTAAEEFVTMREPAAA